MPSERRLAYVISPHGFGHAARAAAVMEALHGMDETVAFDIFTSVPSWFFDVSLTGCFQHHHLVTDVGFAQKSALETDLGETLARVRDFFPLQASVISDLAARLRERRCALVLCDIAPMGILAARHADIPSVLIENFTWDWLYEEYLSEHPGFRYPVRYLKELFSQADFHVQTRPVCRPEKAYPATGPVSRKPRLARSEIRSRLGIEEHEKVVIIAMGGIPESYPFLERLETFSGVRFVLPGVSDILRVRGNMVCIPHRSEVLHPDLVHASDALIGKVGYSTLAEVFAAGIPFGYLERGRFRESGILTAFIKEHMSGLSIEQGDFETGDFLFALPALLSLPRIVRFGPTGADEAAQLVLDVLSSVGG